MAFFELDNIQLRGITACVPCNIEENLGLELFSSLEESEKFIQSTGVERRRVDMEVCTSDLCYHAAENLIRKMAWQKVEIDCLIFVTQTPDYLVPATVCILQSRLGLSEECHAVQISSGCSGWVHGLGVIGSLMSSGQFKKGILLAGEALKFNSPADKSTWPLFGCAGTATAIEFEAGASGFKFHTAVDGSNYEAIIIRDGGCRNPVDENTLKMVSEEEGISRNRLHTEINGMDVFSFGITKPPQSINKLLEHFCIDKNAVDYFVLHQANKFLNDKIIKKLKIDPAKAPCSIKNFGNTSSASIPLTMVTELKEVLKNQSLQLVACGFGVGLAWGSVYFSTDKLICVNLVEL